MYFSLLFDIAPYNWFSIASALFTGSLIGLERQLRGKPVGIRTASLIVLGTYLFLATAFELKGDVIDHSRVVGQVITGIGFLGAGVMLAKDGAVVGVTSAAAIWVLAAIGVMIACDYRLQAIKLSLIVVAILWGIDVLEENTRVLSRGVHASIRRYSDRSKDRRDRNRDRRRQDP